MSFVLSPKQSLEPDCFCSMQNSASVQFSSVAQSCPTLCDAMNHSMPGLPVHHQLPEFIQTHVHRVGDAIQPSHPLSSPSPPTPNPSQHQGLFQWVNSSHEVVKVWEFQLQHQSLQIGLTLRLIREGCMLGAFSHRRSSLQPAGSLFYRLSLFFVCPLCGSSSHCFLWPPSWTLFSYSN